MALGINHYSELLNNIKGIAQSIDFVNTVTQGDEFDIDKEKKNIYNLVHIDILTGSFTNGQTINLDVTITALAQRDTNKDTDTDKFWKQDNEVDNMNITLAILNELWTNLYRDYTSKNITASENPSFTAIKEEYDNTLDGWKLEFTVEMPNTELTLCDGE